MSPDQHVAPKRCMPAAPERQSRNTRWSGRSRRLAFGERLVAEAVVDVVEERRRRPACERGRRRRALAAVEPPARDAELAEVAGGRAHHHAPTAGSREVEVALALAVVGAEAGRSR